MSAEEILATFINGNRTDARAAIGDSVETAGEVIALAREECSAEVFRDVIWMIAKAK